VARAHAKKRHEQPGVAGNEARPKKVVRIGLARFVGPLESGGSEIRWFLVARNLSVLWPTIARSTRNDTVTRRQRSCTAPGIGAEPWECDACDC